MKKIFLSAIFGLLSMASFAQGTIDLTIRYNIAQGRYEVYAKPTFTSSAFTWGPSQITVVPPASAPDVALNITSVNGGGWSSFDRIFAPSASPSNDYHGVISNGQPTVLTAGQETLLFHFTWPDGLCRDGLRLFVNGSDPSSSAAGMQGGDFSNAIDNGLITDVYNVNYNNTGTTCKNCPTNLIAPELIK